jgi:hypothetical protein
MFVDEVHGAAGDLHSIRERLRLRIHSRKRRQQRRVDVHDAIRVALDEGGAQQTHVAGQRDDVRPGFIEHAQHGFLMRGAIRIRLMIEHVRRVAVIVRALDALRVRPVGDDADDLRVQPPAPHCFMDGLEVRSPSGQKDRQAHHSIQEAKPLGGVSYTTLPVPLTTFPMK